LTARGIEEAARTVNVPPRTLYRWLKDAAFDSAYRKAKRLAFGQAIARLHQGSAAVAATMLKIMVDPNVPASTRLRAADCIFTHANSAIETEEIEARVVAPEQAAEVSSHNEPET
jgi:hypothetical protein